MRWTVGREGSRRDESVAHAEKDIPARNRQCQVRVLGGSLQIDAMRMNEDEIARGGTYQEERRLAGRFANCREQPGQRPKNRAIRQVE
jgi:hypothetical protein